MRIIPTGPEKPTIQAQFEEFHRKNPQVYRWLEYFTAQAVERGKHKLGIRMLWERVRWEVYMSTDDPSSEYKINDHYHSRYVRLLVSEHPEYKDLFEMRRLRTA